MKRQFKSSLEVNQGSENSESTASGTSLRHSRTLSMPAINSSQLSDISEHSEFVSLQPPGSLQAGSRNNSATVDAAGISTTAPMANGGTAANKMEHSYQRSKQEEFSKMGQNGSEVNAQNETGGKETGRTFGETGAIEINIQRASTVSDE